MSDQSFQFPRFIVISGLIGVGKSTFTTQLAEHLGYEPFYEPVDGDENPYLELFYKDPKKNLETSEARLEAAIKEADAMRERMQDND